MTLEISQYGRPIVWLAQWSWYGGGGAGYSLFATKDEAIKYAILQAKENMDWKTFPDPKKLYPDDDRDSLHVPELTPVFRATWVTEGGGYSQVTKCQVDDKFIAADYAVTQVEGIFAQLMARAKPDPVPDPPMEW